MVKHVLFVKLKDNSPASCEAVKELFLSMKEHIDFIRELQVGIGTMSRFRTTKI